MRKALAAAPVERFVGLRLDATSQGDFLPRATNEAALSKPKCRATQGSS
jgi:hypothetical protein